MISTSNFIKFIKTKKISTLTKITNYLLSILKYLI